MKSLGYTIEFRHLTRNIIDVHVMAFSRDAITQVLGFVAEQLMLDWDQVEIDLWGSKHVLPCGTHDLDRDVGEVSFMACLDEHAALLAALRFTFHVRINKTPIEIFPDNDVMTPTRVLPRGPQGS